MTLTFSVICFRFFYLLLVIKIVFFYTEAIVYFSSITEIRKIDIALRDKSHIQHPGYLQILVTFILSVNPCSHAMEGKTEKDL